MVTFVGVLIGLLCSIVPFVSLFNFFHKFWWVPMRVKYIMSSQGISGPRYSFINGNTMQISSMRMRSMSLPMDISHYIFPRVQPHIDSWFHIYGKNFMYWVGPQPELVVTEPELLKEIMSDKEISMGKPDVEPTFKMLVGEGLILSEGDKWAKQRKLATHAFHGERLKNMIPSMIESVDKMLKKWKDNGLKEVEVYEEFKIMASEVISRNAFGSSYEDGKQVFQKLEALNLLAAKNKYKNRLPGFRNILKDKDEAESDKLQADIQDLIMQIIINRKNLTAFGDEENLKTDYLGLLLNSHNEFDKSYKLSIQDIIDDCKTFYNSGQGTTSLLLSWVSLLLGIHTEWQEKARNEVHEVFGREKPYAEGIARLKSMGMIINETLRLYPPAVYTVRKVRREMKVGNLVLPANMNLYIPILALQHDPRIWGEDAHLFKPERFSEGISKATNNNPEAYLPFGYGPRKCVGSNFALNEAKITLSMILQRYKFTLSPNYVHAPVHLLTLRPKSGVQILFQPL